MTGAQKTESFKSLIAAIEANDEQAIVMAAAKAVRERLKAKPRRIKCRAN